MLPPPPIPIGFVTHDPKWRLAIERWRQRGDGWQAESIVDWEGLVAWSVRQVSIGAVIEIDASHVEEWLKRIAALRGWGTNAIAAVVGPRELRHWSGPFLEAGAAICAFSVGDCPRLASGLARFAERNPSPQLNLRESIMRSLPWSTADVGLE